MVTPPWWERSRSDRLCTHTYVTTRTIRTYVIEFDLMFWANNTYKYIYVRMYYVGQQNWRNIFLLYKMSHTVTWEALCIRSAKKCWRSKKPNMPRPRTNNNHFPPSLFVCLFVLMFVWIISYVHKFTLINVFGCVYLFTLAPHWIYQLKQWVIKLNNKEKGN